jgi:hypothetical protein
LSRVIYITAACGLTFLAWGVAYSRQAAPKPQVQHTVESNYLSLQQRWDQGEWDNTTVLAKGPRLIQTVKVTPDPVEVAAVTEEPSYQRKKVERTRIDVCRAHRMRKVYVSKHRWRCRR